MPSLTAAFTSPDAKRRHVRRLFATIADRYDLVTRVLSYGQDARWKDRLVAGGGAASPASAPSIWRAAPATSPSGSPRPGRRVCGLDITPRMLQLARARPCAGHCTWTPVT